MKKTLCTLFVLPLLAACYHPPYDQFQPPTPVFSVFKDNRASLIRDLKHYDIQLVQYGEIITLVVPTDRYFIFNSARFHELQYPGLETIVNFIKLYPSKRVTVAGFSDDVKSARRNRLLTDARAHTMLAFLWANGIPSRQLSAKGYGEAYPIGDNRLVHGAAYNRRLEIQWPVQGEEEIEWIKGVKAHEMKQ